MSCVFCNRYYSDIEPKLKKLDRFASQKLIEWYKQQHKQWKSHMRRSHNNRRVSLIAKLQA